MSSLFDFRMNVDEKPNTPGESSSKGILHVVSISLQGQGLEDYFLNIRQGIVVFIPEYASNSVKYRVCKTIIYTLALSWR